MISSWRTLRAPWRIAVPTQSVPVSPPPMTMTSRPDASIGAPASAPPSSSRRVLPRRKLIARWIPPSSRPGTDRSRASVEPVARTTASCSASSRSAATSAPIVTPVSNRTPSSAISPVRRETTSLSSFMFGMPYISSPPMRPARSYTVTRCPARFSWSAAARPAGPLPTTATVLPVRVSGGDRRDPALGPGAVRDLLLDGLDRDRVPAQAHGARPLAGSRADPARELREVVRPVEADRGLLPLAAVDEVVPLGDQVVDRAARGHPADQHRPCGRTGPRSPCSATPGPRARRRRGAGAPRSSRGSAPAAAGPARSGGRTR